MDDPGGPFVGFGDLVRGERAVLGLVLADRFQARPDDEFLPRGLGDPGAEPPDATLHELGKRSSVASPDGVEASMAKLGHYPPRLLTHDALFCQGP